jgi:hypothetical protein
MNTQLLTICILAAAFCFSGCATNNTSDAESKAQAPKPSEKNPEVGMTKDQVIEMYGKTDNIQMSSKGEIWIYNLNMGEAFIPFNFGYRPKMRYITFGADGKVTEWSYSK